MWVVVVLAIVLAVLLVVVLAVVLAITVTEDDNCNPQLVSDNSIYRTRNLMTVADKAGSDLVLALRQKNANPVTKNETTDSVLSLDQLLTILIMKSLKKDDQDQGRTPEIEVSDYVYKYGIV